MSETNNDCVTKCLADDTTIYAIGDTVREADEKLELALRKASEWFSNNQLALSDKKCVGMVTTKQHNRK